MNVHPGLIFELLSPVVSALNLIWKVVRIIILIALVLSFVGWLMTGTLKGQTPPPSAIQGTIERTDTLATEGVAKFVVIKLRSYNERVYVYFDVADGDDKDSALAEGTCVAIIFGADTVTRDIEGEVVTFRSVRLIKKVTDSQVNQSSRGPKSPPGVFFIYSKS